VDDAFDIRPDARFNMLPQTDASACWTNGSVPEDNLLVVHHIDQDGILKINSLKESYRFVS
jgi:hypothetical protein